MLHLKDGNPESLTKTTLTEAGFIERDLHDWIEKTPSEILKDELLLIGSGVTVKGLGDEIDVLAIDPDGNLVIIELKRGPLKDPVDFQSLKYAAYAAHWDYDQLQNQFEKFRDSSGEQIHNSDESFQEVLDDFCNEDYELNQDQRIVLVGEDLRERLHLLIEWLANRNVDVSVIMVELQTDGEEYYLDTKQKIPIPETSSPKVAPDTSQEPWKANGKEWHLEERTNQPTGDLLLELVTAIQDIDYLEGPRWQQKLYVSFRIGRKNRVLLETQTEQIHLRVFDVDPGTLDKTQIAERLEMDDKYILLGDPLARSRRPGLQITCRSDEEVNTERIVTEIDNLLSAESK